LELGIYTFGDLPADASGPRAAQQHLQEIVAAAKLADEAGLHVFGVGEHHRSDCAVSAHTVVLGAIAAVTRRIRLTSAETIISSADPVRVFEDFATLDLLSSGPAELMAGRGAFIESFPLFGFALQDYEALYNEKLELLLKLRHSERITWEGRFRPSLDDAEVSPRPISASLPIWIGAGGTPQSAVRADQAGLPLNLANIGGESARFKPFIDLYRQTGLAAGHASGDLNVAISGHLHVQRDSQRARDKFFPQYTHYMRHNPPQRDQGWEFSQREYEQLASPRGALFVGSPEEIADKILYEHELFGHRRFLAQIDIGGVPYAKVAQVIELLAGDVLPIVKRALAGQNKTTPGDASAAP